jgi:uncharacterized protein (DUF488 family)
MLGLFTIGHSVHPIERFIELLTMHGITALCDVRSSPYSRFTPQFNREALKDELAKNRIVYIYLGSELGPRSSDPTCYKDGKVQYDLLARTDLFQKGLNRLRKGINSYRIALMCAEKDPIVCHRMILICRYLYDGGIRIGHILEDGSIENHSDTEARLMELLKISPDDLFSTTEAQVMRAYDLQGEKIAYVLQEEQENYESH